MHRAAHCLSRRFDPKKMQPKSVHAQHRDDRRRRVNKSKRRHPPPLWARARAQRRAGRVNASRSHHQFSDVQEGNAEAVADSGLDGWSDWTHARCQLLLARSWAEQRAQQRAYDAYCALFPAL
jgi:hypothetical protein